MAESAALRDSSGPLLRFVGLCFDRLHGVPARSECTRRQRRRRLQPADVSKTHRPFKQPKRVTSIREEVRPHWRGRAGLASICRLTATTRGFSRIPAPSRRPAHPRICRRAFRSHHRARTRPPTEREPEALHRAWRRRKETQMTDKTVESQVDAAPEFSEFGHSRPSYRGEGRRDGGSGRRRGAADLLEGL